MYSKRERDYTPVVNMFLRFLMSFLSSESNKTGYAEKRNQWPQSKADVQKDDG